MGAWKATELANRLQHACDVTARDPVINGNVEALSGEVVDDRQALDAAASRERVHHEIHTPDLVWTTGHMQSLPIQHDELPAPALAHRKRRFSIETIDALMVGVDALTSQ
jgi:hypothetical protein